MGRGVIGGGCFAAGECRSRSRAGEGVPYACQTSQLLALTNEVVLQLVALVVAAAGSVVFGPREALVMDAAIIGRS
eukprot:15433778-Alexandrium_andersonii.AAC.1